MLPKPQLEEIKAYYEERYGPHDMGPSRRSPHTFQFFLDQTGVEPGSRLLDVGCGAGALLKQAGSQVDAWGTDLSARAIEISSEVAPAAKLCVGDMQRLPYADESFDRVTNLGSLEHASDMHQALQEMARVSTADGAICVVVPNAKFFWYRFLPIKGTKQRDMQEHLRTLVEWQSLIESTGLVIRQIARDPGPDLGVNPSAGMRLRNLMRRIALALTKIMPITATYQIVFICRKRPHQYLAPASLDHAMAESTLGKR